MKYEYTLKIYAPNLTDLVKVHADGVDSLNNGLTMRFWKNSGDAKDPKHTVCAYPSNMTAIFEIKELK